MVDCDIVDEEWLDLWQSDHQISQSNSFYSMPPIDEDEDYCWSMHSIPQSLNRLNRGGSAYTLPPIGEEMSFDIVCRTLYTHIRMCMFGLFVCCCCVLGFGLSCCGVPFFLHIVCYIHMFFHAHFLMWFHISMLGHIIQTCLFSNLFSNLCPNLFSTGVWKGRLFPVE